MKRLLLVFILVTFTGCKDSKSSQGTDFNRKSKLIELFKTSNSNYPNISVHRGGMGLEKYPENCLETMSYINDSIKAVFEIDVSQTKDGKLILMHDNALDRTTNGSGLVKNLNYTELKDYKLIDGYGKATPFRIPLFKDVLKWCKAKNVILTVDIKRSVSQAQVIDAIRAAKAEDNCVIITYDLKQAQSAFELAPELLLSVSARNHAELDRLIDSGIPTENMLAFTGTRLSKASLYKRLHKEGIVCILGTLGNLDKQAEARGEDMYQYWKSLGVDILATDRPFKAYNAIN